jgi:hypothetical protein
MCPHVLYEHVRVWGEVPDEQPVARVALAEGSALGELLMLVKSTAVATQAKVQ